MIFFRDDVRNRLFFLLLWQLERYLDSLNDIWPCRQIVRWEKKKRKRFDGNRNEEMFDFKKFTDECMNRDRSNHRNFRQTYCGQPNELDLLALREFDLLRRRSSFSFIRENRSKRQENKNYRVAWSFCEWQSQFSMVDFKTEKQPSPMEREQREKNISLLFQLTSLRIVTKTTNRERQLSLFLFSF